MAGEIMIREMLRLFCATWSKPFTEDLFDAWYKALKKHTDEDVREAGFRCLDEREYMPKPPT